MSTTERKEREKALRYEAIIDAAERQFFSRGFENVTMEDIAKELELAKGTLYLYFKNKDELYFAIVLRGVRIMNRMFKESVSGKKSGLDQSLCHRPRFLRFQQATSGTFQSFRLHDLGAARKPRGGNGSGDQSVKRGEPRDVDRSDCGRHQRRFHTPGR